MLELVLTYPKEKMMEDNWKGRDVNMTCSTCRFYVKKASSNGSNLKEIGRCRRHAPTMTGFPVMFLTDWCGDHKIDENKVEKNESI